MISVLRRNDVAASACCFVSGTTMPAAPSLSPPRSSSSSRPTSCSRCSTARQLTGARGEALSLHVRAGQVPSPRIRVRGVCLFRPRRCRLLRSRWLLCAPGPKRHSAESSRSHPRWCSHWRDRLVPSHSTPMAPRNQKQASPPPGPPKNRLPIPVLTLAVAAVASCMILSPTRRHIFRRASI